MIVVASVTVVCLHFHIDQTGLQRNVDKPTAVPSCMTNYLYELRNEPILLGIKTNDERPQSLYHTFF